MGNAERVRQLKSVRNQACGIGTRKLKLMLNRLMKTDPLALAARLAIEIEDANLTAKRYKFSRYQDSAYAKKEALMLDLIALFQHQGWKFGVHKSDRPETSHIIYFEIPGCEQISWHYTHKGDPLPIYPKEWDGKLNSTFPKLLSFVEREIFSAKRAAAINREIPAEFYRNLLAIRTQRKGKAMSDQTHISPLAKTMSELVTPKQLNLIRSLGRQLEINVDEECSAFFSLVCRIDELTIRAASKLIDHLKAKASEQDSHEATSDTHANHQTAA